MIFKDYTPQQMKAFLRPAQVQKEFGLDKGQLEYMRTCSRDEGKLRGPMFLKDDLNCISSLCVALTCTWVNGSQHKPFKYLKIQINLIL